MSWFNYTQVKSSFVLPIHSSINPEPKTQEPLVAMTAHDQMYMYLCFAREKDLQATGSTNGIYGISQNQCSVLLQKDMNHSTYWRFYCYAD